MPTRDITITTLDGNDMPAYIATPEGSGPWPVAVVLGELFGLTDVQREAADRTAALGFVAIAPDLLHRRAPGGPLPEDAKGRETGLALIQELTRVELISDVRTALEFAAMEPSSDPSIAPVAIGMSFGGHVAVLAAAFLDVRACVAMYAGWLAGTDIAASRPQPTGSLPLAGRLLVLAGEADQMIPPSDLQALRSWQPGAEIVTYADTGHRFCSIDRPGYDPDAAADAWTRIARFLGSITSA